MLPFVFVVIFRAVYFGVGM